MIEARPGGLGCPAGCVGAAFLFEFDLVFGRSSGTAGFSNSIIKGFTNA